MVTALAKPGQAIIDEMDPNKAHLLHMAMGVAGEAGELLDAVKKHVMYNKPLDYDNVREEMGDMEFYLEGVRQGTNISRNETLDDNYKKLSVRYKTGSFSNEQAQARADKEEG